MQLHVFTDTVENNHLVIDGITYHCQDCTNEGLVDFERPRRPSPHDGIKTNHADGVACQRNDGTNGEADVAEADEDIDEDADECNEYAEESTISNVFGNRRTYLGRTDD